MPGTVGGTEEYMIVVPMFRVDWGERNWCYKGQLETHCGQSLINHNTLFPYFGYFLLNKRLLSIRSKIRWRWFKMYCVKSKNGKTVSKICLTRGRKIGNVKCKLDSLTKCFVTRSWEKELHNSVRFKRGQQNFCICKIVVLLDTTRLKQN